MKKLFLLATMLVATQFAWAAEPMFFCGQTYYESQEIKSEYIKAVQSILILRTIRLPLQMP